MKLRTIYATVAFTIALAAVIYQNPHLVYKVPLFGWALGPLVGFQMPPFLNKDIFSKCYDKEICPWLTPNDVVIAACGKCGTNWMMTAVHELRTWDQPQLREFRDILDVVPWPLLVPHPAADRDHPEKEWGNDWNHSDLKFHVFKANLAPVTTDKKNKKRHLSLPVRERRDVKFLAIVRNPVDVLHSAAVFSSGQRPEFKALWGDFPSFQVTPMEMFQYFKTMDFTSPFVLFKEWMWFAGDENVLILHYSNVFKDTKKNLKIIAEFVGLKDIPEEAFDEINERVSFEYMKKRGDKYTYLAGVNKSLSMQYSSSLIKSGGTYAGSSRDKLTPEEKKQVDELGKQVLGDTKNSMLANGFEAIHSKMV